MKLSAVFIALVLLGVSAYGAPVVFESHRINLTLDVPNHSATIADSGRATLSEGWNWFYLNKTAQVSSFFLNGKECTYKAVSTNETSQLPTEMREKLSKVEDMPDQMLICFEQNKAEAVQFAVTYLATFNEDVSNVRFSRESVGREVSGTILEQGAYLSPSSYFYPQGGEHLATFALTADMPSNWESVSDGNKIGSEVNGERKQQSWENPYQNDGCILMAAPYVARSVMTDSTEVTCLFFEADTSLFASYLEATAKYVKMYSELIGPYPFAQFTVAENFFPTGYGMPGWTLLGQSVIRLPFIIGSSLGHEVLHNWWGNSVYVDYSRGNWCEGLTVYGADYRFKLAESQAAAKEHRKDILKQYVSYVSKDKDFPLREFTSRTSPNTRAIGYNKAMMVFHMIEEEIGTEAFFDAWKLVYSAYIGKQVGWEEWVKAFETTSKKDLSFVIPQWVNRSGAPVLGIEVLGAVDGPNAGTKKVSLKVTQSSGDSYRLRVPISVEGAAGKVDTTIELSGEAAIVQLVAGEGASVSVDPDYHLFRRLYPEEVEPIISAVLGMPGKAFVIGQADEQLNAAFREFAGNVAEDSALVMTENEKRSVPQGAGVIVLNPSEMPEDITKQIKISNDSVQVSGIAYARAGHTFVLSGKGGDNAEKYWVVLTKDFGSLPRLGQLVPHYGKYSYLVFEGAKNIAKGQWQVTESPLRVVVQ